MFELDESIYEKRHFGRWTIDGAPSASEVLCRHEKDGLERIASYRLFTFAFTPSLYNIIAYDVMEDIKTCKLMQSKTFFEDILTSCWKSEVSICCMLGKVVTFLAPNGADVGINRNGSVSNSGAKKTMKSILGFQLR